MTTETAYIVLIHDVSLCVCVSWIGCVWYKKEFKVADKIKTKGVLFVCIFKFQFTFIVVCGVWVDNHLRIVAKTVGYVCIQDWL